MLLSPLVILGGVLFVYDAAKGLVLSTWYRPRVFDSFKQDFEAINSHLNWKNICCQRAGERRTKINLSMKSLIISIETALFYSGPLS